MSRQAERSTGIVVPQEMNASVREGFYTVPYEYVATIFDVEPLGAQDCRYDGLRECRCLKDLHAGASSPPDRNADDARPAIETREVFHEAREFDAWIG